MAMVVMDMVDIAVDTMEDMDTTMARDLLKLMLSLDMVDMDMVAMDMAVDTDMEDTDTTMARDLLSLDMEAMVDTDMAVDTVMVMDTDTMVENSFCTFKSSLFNYQIC